MHEHDRGGRRGGGALRVVGSSPAAPAEALRAHFLTGLADREPTTGLNDVDQVTPAVVETDDHVGA